jgi:hypothetical protein
VWLEGLRVDPLHRGKGIAAAINKKAMGIIAGLKPDLVRFSTVYDNWASRHMGEQDGFGLIYQCRRMLTGPLEGDLPAEARAGQEDVDEIMAFLKRSSNYKRVKGLFAWGWTFKILDRPFLERVVAEEGALAARRGKKIGALALFMPQRHGPKASLGFIDGNQEEIVTLARQFQIAAGQKGHQELLTMVPEKIAPHLGTAGFREEEPVGVVVYELSGEKLKKTLSRARARE